MAGSRGAVDSAGGGLRDEAGCEYVQGLERCFESHPDSRVVPRCEHQLLDIIAVTQLAVMCGAEDWPEIELFGQQRLEFVKTFLALPHGIPSHDTFRRVFGRLDRTQFSACLFTWTQALCAAVGGKVNAIDGKALRQSYRQ